MKLSVITINYNNADGLQSTIKSIQNQNISDFEYLVIDGGSTDDSLDVIKDHSAVINYWLSEPDNGIYDAMNKGILKAKGDYVQFMNSGDVFYGNDSIKTELRYIENYPEADIFYGDMVLLKGDGHEPFRVKQPPQLDVSFFRNNTINHQAAMIKRALFEDNLYHPQYKIAGDYVKFTEFALQGKMFKYIDEILVGYDFNGLSTTEKGMKQYAKECAEYWKANVPQGLDNIIADYSMIRADTDHAFVKRSIRVHKFIQLVDDRVKQLKRSLKKGLKSLIGK